MTEIFPWFRTNLERIEGSFNQDRLAHALLISAPFGAGKLEFSKHLAKAILCYQPGSNPLQACGQCKACTLFEAETHPDIKTIERLVDNKGKQKQSIGIDQIRELTGKLSETPQLSGWRIAIITSVTDMTTSAFNALLKTLEEPGEKTLLLLLTDNLQKVPATIKSRCQIQKPDLSHQAVVDWLKSKTEVPRESIEKAIELANGAPLFALQILQDDVIGSQKQVFDSFDRVLSNQLTPQELIANSDMDEGSLISLLAEYFHFIQSSKKLANEASKYSKVSDQLVYDIYDKLIAYQRAQFAGSNLQPKLQLQAILIQWFEFGRKLNHISKA